MLLKHDDPSADNSEALTDYDFSENEAPPEEASLEVEESFYSSESSDDEDQCMYFSDSTQQHCS